MTRKTAISIAFRLLFLLLAAGLLCYTIRHTDADVLAALRDGARLPLVSALALYGLAQILGAWRWQTLLAVQGLHLTLWTALRLTLVGNFFSLIIPGSVTGDILKIAIASQRYPGKVTELTLVDLVDRVIGLAGIFFAAAVATMLCANLLPGIFAAKQSWIVALAILAINLGCLGTILLYLLWLTQPRWTTWNWVQRLQLALKRILPKAITRIARRMNDALGLYRKHQRALLTAMVISVVIHLTVSSTVFCLGRALHENQMRFGQYALTTQLANVTGILPITPGGIGLRDAVSAQLFEHFHAEPASVRGDIPLLNSLIIVFWGLAGALIYACSPSFKKPAQTCADAEQLAQAHMDSATLPSEHHNT